MFWVNMNYLVILFIPVGIDVNNSQKYFSLCILRAEGIADSEYFLRTYIFKPVFEITTVKCLTSSVEVQLLWLMLSYLGSLNFLVNCSFVQPPYSKFCLVHFAA